MLHLCGRKREMRGVTRIVSILTVGLLLATGMTAPASADFDPNDCYMVGAAEYVDFRAMVWDMVQAGELTTDEAFYLSCDPRRASERVSYDVEVVRDDEHRFVERDMPTLDEAGDVITVDVGPVIEGLDIIDVIDGANAAPAMAERVGAADGMASRRDLRVSHEYSLDDYAKGMGQGGLWSPADTELVLEQVDQEGP